MDQLRLRQGQAGVAVDQQVPVRRRHEDRPRRQPVPLGRLLHREPRAATQDLRHQAAVARVEVLHDHQGGRENHRQVTHDMEERRQAARRGGDADHVERGSGEMRRGLGTRRHSQRVIHQVGNSVHRM